MAAPLRAEGTDPRREATPVAIICGGGSLPFAVADALRAQGRGVVMLALRGFADPALIAHHPHHWVSLGQFSHIVRLAKADGCCELVFIGTLVRPALSQVRPDWLAVKHLPKLLAAYRGGDNHLLSGIAALFEEQGFRILGAHEVAPQILLPAGPLGRLAPTERDRGDITRGLGVLRAIGPFDVGQAVVVADGQVLAIEASEGTDELLARVADLRRRSRITVAAGQGVLVKAPKPDQDHRFDLPAIGPATVAGVAGAGLAGVAVVAGASVVAEPQDVAARADTAGVFVFGVTDASGAA